MNRELRPPDIAPPAANYAHAVLTEGSPRWLHTSGVVPITPDGTVPQELDDQADQVWSNISAMLDAAQMSAADIVSITTYVVVSEDLAPVIRARDRFMQAGRAASTLVTVPALARPEWKVEIAIVAAAP